MATPKFFGNIPDHHDARDVPLYTSDHVEAAHQVFRKIASESRGPYVLEPLPPVYNQLSIGSCTANAVAAALRFAYVKGLDGKYEDFDPSRMHLYFLARTRDNPGSDPVEKESLQYKAEHDDGSKIRTAISSLNVMGVCKEEWWPYNKPNADKVTHEFKTVDPTNKNRILPNPVEPQDWNTVSWKARDYIPRAIFYYRILDPNFKVQDGTPESVRGYPTPIP